MNGDPETATYHWDYAHTPLTIKDYAPNTQFEIMVHYEWYSSPANDFTVKIYSKHNGTDLFNRDGNTNMLYTDGREPSEFNTNNIDDYWQWYFEFEEEDDIIYSDDETIWTVEPTNIDYKSFAERNVVYSLAAATLIAAALNM